jgi:transketolase
VSALQKFERLRADARTIRKKLLKMHYEAKAGHIGSGLSSVDILTYLYRSWLTDADKFILSKGHGASALYAVLHHLGRISDAELQTYYKDDTLLAAHPAPLGLKDITAATGSLGHGMAIANGLAWAGLHVQRNERRVACLVSDGECNEGSVWESAMFASHHKLTNLLVCVDANGLQGFGKTSDVMNMEPMAEKWRAFGFETREVSGHDFEALQKAFQPAPDRPVCVIARTVKGKGVSFMENEMSWHYLTLDEAKYRLALSELETDAD